MSKKIKLQKRKDKNKLDLLGRVMGFPDDPFGKGAYITLKENRQAIIDGCYGIVEYSDEKVVINIGNKQICFIGCDFDITDFTGTNITVRGNIKNIEFC